MKHLQVYWRWLCCFSKTKNSGSFTGGNGDVLSLTGNNSNGNPIFTLGGSLSKTLTFDFGTTYADAELMILAT